MRLRLSSGSCLRQHEQAAQSSHDRRLIVYGIDFYIRCDLTQDGLSMFTRLWAFS